MSAPSEENALTFVKFPATDRVQYWCEEIKSSIFFTERGVEIAGPDLISALLVSRERLARMSKWKADAASVTP